MAKLAKIYSNTNTNGQQQQKKTNKREEKHMNVVLYCFPHGDNNSQCERIAFVDSMQ